MARSTRSTDTERAFLHRTLAGIPADRIDALCDAVLAIAEHGESIDLGELKVGVHNLIVVALSGARWYRSAVAAAEAYHARMTDREVTAQRELDAATANRRAAAELLADLKEDAWTES